MWTRKELKTNAKAVLKANYWKMVLVGFILTLLTGGGGYSVGTKLNNAEFKDQIAGLGQDVLAALLVIVVGIVAVSFVVDLVLTIFVWNPLEVGCERFCLLCKTENPSLKELFYAFKNGYGHVGFVMFCRTLFQILWTLLLVIPGIVKSYEYLMIPYLLAEDPTMDRKEAFERSKAMMRGNKWKAFVLDLSFLGWLILGGLTFGILDLFYVHPYLYLTHAELYHTLKSGEVIVE